MVVVISPGSHVVKLPIITIISLLAWAGNTLSVLNAKSKPFFNEGSPTNWVVDKPCIALACLRPFPVKSITFSLRLFLKINIPS